VNGASIPQSVTLTQPVLYSRAETASLVSALDGTPSTVDIGVDVHMRPGNFTARTDKPELPEEFVSTNLSLPDPGRLIKSLGHRREEISEGVSSGQEPTPLRTRSEQDFPFLDM